MHVKEAAQRRRSEAKRTGQAENWGRPSGGADFLLYRRNGGFTVHVNEAEVGDRGKSRSYHRDETARQTGRSSLVTSPIAQPRKHVISDHGTRC